MDSYGLNPEFYNFDSFMNENATTWLCNSKSIQNPLSVVCGHYCVYGIRSNLDWNNFFSLSLELISHFGIRFHFCLNEVSKYQLFLYTFFFFVFGMSELVCRQKIKIPLYTTDR